MLDKLPVKGVFSDRYHASLLAHQSKGGEEPELCIYCGKPTLRYKGFYLYLTGMNEAVLPSKIAELKRDDDLGYYAVGPECIKQVVASEYAILDPWG